MQQLTPSWHYAFSEIHREFNRPLHWAYVDIKAAFDFVDRVALRKALKVEVFHTWYCNYWRTFTPKQAQRCVQAGSIKPLQYVVWCTPGVRIGTRPILHSHRLDTEPSSTASWYHSRRSMLHGPGLCGRRSDLPVWWRSSSGLFQCPQQRGWFIWSKDVMDQNKSAEFGKWAPLQ